MVITLSGPRSAGSRRRRTAGRDRRGSGPHHRSRCPRSGRNRDRWRGCTGLAADLRSRRYRRRGGRRCSYRPPRRRRHPDTGPSGSSPRHRRRGSPRAGGGSHIPRRGGINPRCSSGSRRSSRMPRRRSRSCPHPGRPRARGRRRPGSNQRSDRRPGRRRPRPGSRGPPRMPRRPRRRRTPNPRSCPCPRRRSCCTPRSARGRLRGRRTSRYRGSSPVDTPCRSSIDPASSDRTPPRAASPGQGPPLSVADQLAPDLLTVPGLCSWHLRRR